MFGVMRAARNMKLPPRKPGDSVWRALGLALVIACIPVATMLLVLGLLTLARTVFDTRPASCTCDMIKNHECSKP